jgi:hypothetical protein
MGSLGLASMNLFVRKLLVTCFAGGAPPPRPIGIIELAENTFQIFGSKGVWEAVISGDGLEFSRAIR